MTVKEQIAEEGRAYKWILTKLRNCKRPLGCYTDLSRFKHEGISMMSIRRACWCLLDDGKVKFDEMNRLVLVGKN